MIQHITFEGKILAIIIRSSFQEPGIHFITPDEFSQQLAYMKHPAGKIIEPHVHNQVQRDVFFTQEVLFLKKGSLRVDFYNENRDYHESTVIYTGDTLLLASGGHGFEALEEIEMIEVKQGPYVGEADKTRFPSVARELLQVPAEVVTSDR